MEYLIVTLLKGKPKKYQQKLLYSIPKKFKAKRAILRKPPAHITLKHFFKTKNIGPVEECIRKICSTHKKSKYKIKGFNHIRRDVLFLDIIPSTQMKKVHKELLKSLKEETKIKLLGFDKKPIYHSSIAYHDIKEEFEEILLYLSKFNPKFNAFFDNIAILKVEDNKLKIHKQFSLK